MGKESGGKEMESVAASGAADDNSVFVQPMSCECPKTKHENMNVFDAIIRKGFFDHVLYVLLRFLFSDAPPPVPGVPDRIIHPLNHEVRLS